jgi:hypothetical protein
MQHPSVQCGVREGSGKNGTNGKIGSSDDGSLLRTEDLDDIRRSSVLDVLAVDDVSSGGVVVPAGNDDLDTMLLLELLQCRRTLANDGRVGSLGDDDTPDDAGLEGGDFLLEGGADLLGDGFGSGDRDGVGLVSLAGEAYSVA